MKNKIIDIPNQGLHLKVMISMRIIGVVLLINYIIWNVPLSNIRISREFSNQGHAAIEEATSYANRFANA